MKLNSILLIFCASYLTVYQVETTPSSKITLNRTRAIEYEGILIALDPKINSSAQCGEIVRNLQAALEKTSKYLKLGTDNQADFGVINILIPHTLSTCDDFVYEDTTKKDFTYDSADIKITGNQPLSKILPWTKHSGTCGEPGQVIFISPEFLASGFNVSAKGKIILQEWSKFRYGVFEEHGYFDDEVYPPCYYQGGQRFTSCVNLNLTPLDDQTNINPEQCKSLISANQASLLRQIRNGQSSLMFAPHLPSISTFCDQNTHNLLAPTKQNVLCGRKSIRNIMSLHPDFSVPSKSPFKTERAPTFKILRHFVSNHNTQNGYVFIIEDTPELHQFGRMRYVKQAVSQMVSLAEPEGTGFIFKFQGTLPDLSNPNKREFGSPANRQLFLKQFPELAPFHFDEKLSLPGIFNNVLNHAIFQDDELHYKLIFISASPPQNIQQILPTIAATDHELTILTFDDSKDWLQFNAIPNTVKVLHIPVCKSPLGGGVDTCNGKSSNLILDHLLTLLGTGNRPKYFQKVAETAIFGGETAGSFEIPPNIQTNSKFHVAFTQVGEARLTELRYGNTICEIGNLFEYQFVQILNHNSINCPIRAGVWSFTLEDAFDPAEVQSFITAYIEPQVESDSNLKIDVNYGRRFLDEFQPEIDILPVFVGITTTLDEPVVDASVSVQTIKSNLSENSEVLTLKDDGIHPDITGNDGIYSGFILDFGRNPGYLTGDVKITTENAKIIKGLDPSRGNAALLDPDMEAKCCGSTIYAQTSNIQLNSPFSLPLPSIRIAWSGVQAPDDPYAISKPSKINGINFDPNAESVIEVPLNFLAPGGAFNQGRVSFYECCCTPIRENVTIDDNAWRCGRVPELSCNPVPAGNNQICTIPKSSITPNFQNESLILETLVVNCGMIGVNSALRRGDLSQTLFEIQLNFAEIERNSNQPTCDSISDDCLPIWVFWLLLGLLIALFLVIVTVAICWFCHKNGNKEPKPRNMEVKHVQQPKEGKVPKEKKVKRRGSIPSVLSLGSDHEFRGKSRDVNVRQYPQQNVPNSFDETATIESGGLSPKNVYINRAYIHDNNGDMRLVAADGKLFDVPRDGAPTSSPPPIPPPQSNKDWAREDLRNVTSPYQSTLLKNHNERNVYFPGASNQRQNQNQTSNQFQNQTPNHFQNQMQNSFQAQLAPPQPKDRSIKSKPFNPYANGVNATLPPPQPPRPAPEYASLNTNRYRPRGAYPLPGMSDTSHSRNSLASSLSSILSPKEDKETTSYFPNNQREPRFKAPMTRMDRFPSSESDSYSDARSKTSISSYIPPPPPLPPPPNSNLPPALPKKMKVRNQNHLESPSVRMTKMKSIPSLSQGIDQISPIRFPGSRPPTSASSSSASESKHYLRPRSGAPEPISPVSPPNFKPPLPPNKPKYVPPPGLPPPRPPVKPDGLTRMPNSVSDDEDYDEDSDNWDDGFEFFPPGETQA